MKHPTAKLFPLFLLLSLMNGCGKSPEKAAFTGTWDFNEENVIMNKSVVSQVAVASLPPKFRIETKSDGSESLEVYDGNSLHRRNRYLPHPAMMGSGDEEPAEDGEASGPSQTYSDGITPEKAAAMRFWADSVSGQSSAGGLVAGRDTILYSGTVRRQDGEFTLQIWVDSKTGVQLKSIETVYSSQVRSIVTRNSKECKSIDFTPPADAVFARP